MKIFGLCVVKNEVDIVGYTLAEAAAWCDQVFVYDNASTDGTTEIVRRMSTTHPQIVLHTSDDRDYAQRLWSNLYNAYRDEATVGDWWCRLDADELYIDDPRVFLSKVPSRDEGVWNASFQYHFTDRDLAAYEANPDVYGADRHPTERLRYYRNDWSELRFARHTTGMDWPLGRGWPLRIGPSYPVRIWLRHFKNRSPEQMQQRLETRLAVASRTGGREFVHEMLEVDDTNDQSTLWRQRIAHAKDLDYDGHDGRFVTRDDLMPPIGGSYPTVRAFARKLGLSRDSFRPLASPTRRTKSSASAGTR